MLMRWEFKEVSVSVCVCVCGRALKHGCEREREREPFISSTFLSYLSDLF